MSQRIAVVTGTSSGIGQALAGRLLADDWQVFGVARREVKRPEPNYRHVQADLSDPSLASTTLGPLLAAEMAFGSFDCLAVVNNAAVTGQLRSYGDQASAATFRDVAINLAAPIALMDMAVRARPEGAKLRIVNISSGLAYRAMPGGAEYCSTKAGLHMAGEVMASEGHPDTAIFNYAPGIVATEMQQTLRSQPADQFQSVDMFKAMHEEDRLASPEEVVNDIVQFLDDPAARGFIEGRFGA